MSKRATFYLSLLITAAFVIYYIALSLHQNNGRLIYPVDDTYIHMAMAKNFSQYATWGVTPFNFSSSTSSPLYTLLVSGFYFLFGVHDFYPLLVNIIFGFCVLYSIYKYAKKNWTDLTYFICTICILLLTPFSLQVLSGMEHTLHIFLSIALFAVAVEVLNKPENKKKLMQLLCIVAISSVTRYETIFFVAIIGLLFLLQKQFKEALLLILAAILPLLIYGYISKSNGSFYVPNSILVKGNMPEMNFRGIVAFIYSNYFNFYTNPQLLSCVCLLLLTLYATNVSVTFFKIIQQHFLIVIMLAVIVMHTYFAKTGWFFRYEAYLIVLTMMAIAPLIGKLVTDYKNKIDPAKNYVLLFLTGVFILPLVIRFTQTLYVAQKASNNIYEQQMQMALFIHNYYSNRKIAANDIGAISYYNTIHLFDLVGLATADVLKNSSLKNKALPKTSFVDYYAKKNNIEIAIVYDKWFENQLPVDWKKAGEWKLKDNRVCGNDLISFYATDSIYFPELKKNLKEFSATIDNNTKVIGVY